MSAAKQVWLAAVNVCSNASTGETLGRFTATRRDSSGAVAAGSGTLVSWNLALPSGTGAPAGRIEAGGARRYYLTGRLGSVRTVVSGEGGGVVETRDYYPFGLRMPGRTGVAGTAAKEGFTGHERDDQTQLLYAGARYLMPALARWTTTDPLLDEMTPNALLKKDYRYLAQSPYNYVHNNPLGYVDPDGKQIVPEVARRSAQIGQQRNSAPPVSDKTAAEVVVGFIPVAGEGADAYEAFTGRTWTGQDGSRLAAGVALALPFVAASMLRGADNLMRGGSWTRVSESMSSRAAAYQEQVAGSAGRAYVKSGVKFDGFKEGVFIEAKGPGYANFVEDGRFQSWFSGADELVSQAQRQLNAAEGGTIQWHVAEKEAANAMRNLLRSRSIEEIDIIHSPVE